MKRRPVFAPPDTDGHGVTSAIKEKIGRSVEDASSETLDKDAEIDALMARLGEIRSRLSPRIPGMPDDATLWEHLSTLNGDTLRTLLRSGAWDTLIVGGEEVDIDIFYRQAGRPASPIAPQRSGVAPGARAGRQTAESLGELTGRRALTPWRRALLPTPVGQRRPAPAELGSAVVGHEVRAPAVSILYATRA